MWYIHCQTSPVHINTNFTSRVIWQGSMHQHLTQFQTTFFTDFLLTLELNFSAKYKVLFTTTLLKLCTSSKLNPALHISQYRSSSTLDNQFFFTLASISALFFYGWIIFPFIFNAYSRISFWKLSNLCFIIIFATSIVLTCFFCYYSFNLTTYKNQNLFLKIKIP